MITDKGRQNSEAVNVLPCLLQAVVNHDLFKGAQSSPQSSTVKRDLGSIFESSPDVKQCKGDSSKKEKLRAIVDDHVDVASTWSVAGKTEGEGEEVTPNKSNSPTAANIEAIIGNVCKDMLNKKSEFETSRVHGLLIAVLSIFTGCFISEDDVEKLQLGEVKDSPQPRVPPTFDSLGKFDQPSHLLQVGAILSVLRSSSAGKMYDGSETARNFFLDDNLLGYFAEASSTYEERIEIQKANLFSQCQTPSASKKHKETNEIYTEESAKSLSQSSSAASSPPLPLTLLEVRRKKSRLQAISMQKIIIHIMRNEECLFCYFRIRREVTSMMISQTQQVFCWTILQIL